MAEVAKEQHAIVERNGQIVQAIAVVVAHGAGHRMAVGLQPCACRIQIFKAAVAFAVQHANRLRARLHQHQVHLPEPVTSIMQAPPVVVHFALGRSEPGIQNGCATSFTGIIARFAVSGSITAVTVE